MLKSYITTLKANTPTIICEPELGYELAVKCLSIFGGANGGYVTISIGDFSMEHSIAANGRIVFPFFMGVSQFMSLIAESNSDGILISVAAEQFACDKEDLGPEPPKDGNYMPLTIRNMQNVKGDFNFYRRGSSGGITYQIDYKSSNNSTYWNNTTFTNNYPGIIKTLPSQGYIQIRQRTNTFSSNENIYLNLYSNVICEVLGDIKSLVNYSDDNSGVFYNLFRSSKIKKASNLILDNINLQKNSFNHMFYGCSELVEAPAFPNKSLTENCFFGTYKSCINLVKAPEIPKRTLVKGCYSELFYGCINLNEIIVNFTDWGSNATTNWVSGVANTGTFYKPSALPEIYGPSYIPVGWTVVNID